MNQIFLIILLYVIFGVIGPIIKRIQRQQQKLPSTTPTEAPRTPQKKMTSDVEKYFTRLQDAFQQPPELPQTAQQTESKLLSISEKPATPEKTTLELLPPPLPVKPRVSTSYKRPVVRGKSAVSPKSASLLDFKGRNSYMQGILMAEILGPPASKRQKR